MIKVLLKGDREIAGDWDKYDIQKTCAVDGSVVALILKLEGEDGKANFNMFEVIGWHDVKWKSEPELEAEPEGKPTPTKVVKP